MGKEFWKVLLHRTLVIAVSAAVPVTVRPLSGTHADGLDGFGTYAFFKSDTVHTIHRRPDAGIPPHFAAFPDG